VWVAKYEGCVPNKDVNGKPLLTKESSYLSVKDAKWVFPVAAASSTTTAGSVEAANSSSAPAPAAGTPPPAAESAEVESPVEPVAGPTASVKTVVKALPNTPFLVTVPTTAVLKKGDGAQDAEVYLHEGGPRLKIDRNILGVVFGNLDEFQKSCKKDNTTIVSKTGSGDHYSVVYKPFPNMFTYFRFFTVGDKELECFVEGLYGQDDIPTYDAICKSVRAKK
jgi:hypothetical protein